ncbi:MAG: hypothetical protein H6823_03270 [Planctomycetaceae bacterium]|nr:hypothetical protein [Planctomycetaceae bacterium]
MLHFRYGYCGNSPSTVVDAALMWSRVNQRAAVRLATLLRQLHAERSRLGSNEPINLILYSNGSNVGYLALEHLGVAVDNVLILGGSIDSSATDF